MKGVLIMKVYNWNASLVENNEVEISLRFQGLNKPALFVQAFQTGKQIIEGIQSGTGTWLDYYLPLSSFLNVVISAVRKSQ